MDATNASTPEPSRANTRAALIVFAKPPIPGQVKTRLTPVLTPEEAAQLYRAFLLDALDQYRTLGVDIHLYLSPGGNGDLGSELPEGVVCFEQEGAGLAARMHAAFEATFASDYGQVAIIGTDHPTLPSAFLKQAFVALATPEAVCLGPSNDGGYYLLGMNAFYPQLFEGMTYSHDRVFANTLQRAGRTGARLTVLPRWYDVDEPEDVRRMIDDLGEVPNGAQRTRAVIDELGLAELHRAK